VGWGRAVGYVTVAGLDKPVMLGEGSTQERREHERIVVLARTSHFIERYWEKGILSSSVKLSTGMISASFAVSQFVYLN